MAASGSLGAMWARELMAETYVGSMLHMSQALQSAVRTLQRRGRTVTMASLAQTLGVSRATLYRRYGAASTVGVESGAGLRARKSDEALFAAVKVTMGERGLRGTTLEAVAERAGVSVATLHRRFGDRLGLLRAFIDATPARRAGRALAGADVDDVRGVLSRFTALALREFESSQEVTRAMLGDPEAARELGARARDPARGVSAGVMTYFSRCVQAGSLRGAPPALTAFFLSSLFGYGLLIGSLQGGPVATEQAVPLLVNGFLDGAAGR